MQLHFEDGSSHIAQHVIWAIGRKPNVQDLNLEAAGVTLNERGFIAVDEYQNTVVPGIYALGDVTGEKELTPVAIKAGRTLAERLFNYSYRRLLPPRYWNCWANRGRGQKNLWS